ncbi:PREDICTED: snRNA-activating protein complex subunit 3 [Vollenhovia emeryi]|uniref:snRNA-activating protein complex subunit 3 n=1 Tax=Vollenhovia emeryi TaxID=411798 RepID=UPI0005F5097A|nr:PREDICTED: snRNA-activating protein complex subunit 3 [Vollenhovia emeryi]
MDQVYKLYDRQASPKINIKDYFQQYSELIKSSMYHEVDKQGDEKVSQLMGGDLTRGRVNLIKHYCSIDNLTLPAEAANAKEREEQEYVNIPDTVSENVPLETIKVLKTLSKETVQKSRWLTNGIPVEYDYSRLHNYSRDDSVQPNEEFLVYVRIYEPFKSYSRYVKYKTSLPVLKLKSIISVLGCQTLHELRKKIMCQSDWSITKDTSENPHEKPGPMAKDLYPSGFFYIEDTFYNDTSAQSNVDYSDVILQWAAARDIGPFKVSTMDAKINSLCTRFGFPWVYQHQGSCEHLIILTDARLLTVDDVLVSSAYPRIERLRTVVGKNCIYCGIFNVHWIVTEHDRIPHDISYFCNKCFISYNYVDGKKVGNFKAYSYPCIPQLVSIRKPRNLKQDT